VLNTFFFKKRKKQELNSHLYISGEVIPGVIFDYVKQTTPN